MKNEMDLLRMDERQRLAWFMANRGTLIAVGAVWIGMIAWELTHDRLPGFLLIMVPVMALLRAGLYAFYTSRPCTPAAADAGADAHRDPACVRYGKWLATLLLVVATVLPIYRVAAAPGQPEELRFAWDLVRDDPLFALPLALVYLWPLAVLGIQRLHTPRWIHATVQFSEPFLAGASAIVVLWITQLVIETRVLLFLLVGPAEPIASWSCYLAVAANALYVVAWIAGLLRPVGMQEG